VTCGFTGWTVAIFLLRRALPGDSGHEDARTLYVRLPHLTVKLQGCAGPAKRQRPKKSSVALELRFGDRAMALCLRIEGKGRGGGGITSYGHLGCLWSAGLRLGMRLGQSRRRLGLKGDWLEVGDRARRKTRSSQTRSNSLVSSSARLSSLEFLNELSLGFSSVV
jgi:hypothetical protein